MKLCIDSMHPRVPGEIEATDIDQVEQLIRRLDQDRYTIVSLGEPDRPLLMVCGGKGDYVVTATPDGKTWSGLAMGPRDGASKRINGGGQPAEFPSHEVATLDQALAAARYFFQHGALDPSLTWET